MAIGQRPSKTSRVMSAKRTRPNTLASDYCRRRHRAGKVDIGIGDIETAAHRKVILIPSCLN